MMLHKTCPTWGETVCGKALFAVNPPKAAERWHSVTCPKCLRNHSKRRKNNAKLNPPVRAIFTGGPIYEDCDLGPVLHYGMTGYFQGVCYENGENLPPFSGRFIPDDSGFKPISLTIVDIYLP